MFQDAYIILLNYFHRRMINYELLTCHTEASKVPGESFFNFLSLKKVEDQSFCLDSLFDMYQDDKPDDFLHHLLRIQVKACNEIFFQNLRGNASIKMAKDKLPLRLCSADFDDAYNWFLALVHVIFSFRCFQFHVQTYNLHLSSNHLEYWIKPVKIMCEA